MPMDGFTLSYMTRELQGLLVGGRIDKVAQPDSDAVVLGIRSQGGNHKLLLCANANRARVQLTDLPYENPAEPPMFCMLLRKHLSGAHITAVEQLFGDRILRVEMDTLGEMNDRVRRTLYLELMGRHSNLTLCDETGRIIDFQNPAYDNLAVPAEIADRFKVTGKKVVLEGLCGDCGIN